MRTHNWRRKQYAASDAMPFEKGEVLRVRDGRGRIVEEIEVTGVNQHPESPDRNIIYTRERKCR